VTAAQAPWSAAVLQLDDRVAPCRCIAAFAFPVVPEVSGIAPVRIAARYKMTNPGVSAMSISTASSPLGVWISPHASQQAEGQRILTDAG
jgi:hypothetical protein